METEGMLKTHTSHYLKWKCTFNSVRIFETKFIFDTNCAKCGTQSDFLLHTCLSALWWSNNKNTWKWISRTCNYHVFFFNNDFSLSKYWENKIICWALVEITWKLRVRFSITVIFDRLLVLSYLPEWRCIPVVTLWTQELTLRGLQWGADTMHGDIKSL